MSDIVFSYSHRTFGDVDGDVNGDDYEGTERPTGTGTNRKALSPEGSTRQPGSQARGPVAIALAVVVASLPYEALAK